MTHTVVIGAGMSGLVAARSLQDHGHRVTLLDKGRRPGGRLATRRIDGATFDHGAQFFTVRSDTFSEMVQPWIDSGLVFEWSKGFTEADGHPRYAVRGGMNALAKQLAGEVEVRCNTLVFGIRGLGNGWAITMDDASVVDADALVITCPIPQSFSLLIGADVDVPESLWRIEYDRTLALLAVLDGPTNVPAPGGVQGVDGFNFIGDNQAKGISALPALTVHADAVWSEAHWDDEPQRALELLTVAAAPWIGDAKVIASQLKRWRFATPRTIWPDPCWQGPANGPPVVLAGDAFAGPRIEGAALSGLAAARALL